jgi:hypothetical protein
MLAFIKIILSSRRLYPIKRVSLFGSMSILAPCIAEALAYSWRLKADHNVPLSAGVPFGQWQEGKADEAGVGVAANGRS